MFAFLAVTLTFLGCVFFIDYLSDVNFKEPFKTIWEYKSIVRLEKTVRGTFKVTKKHWKFILIVFISLILLLKTPEFIDKITPNESTKSGWLGFYGSYIGGIVGGIIAGVLTYIGVILTLKKQENEKEEKQYFRRLDLLLRIERLLENILKKVDKKIDYGNFDEVETILLSALDDINKASTNIQIELGGILATRFMELEIQFEEIEEDWVVFDDRYEFIEEYRNLIFKMSRCIYEYRKKLESEQ